MSYLGLDLATNTGWQLWKPGEARPRGGTLRLKRRNADELAPDFERLREHLSDLHKQFGPIEGVWYEAPIKMRVDSVATLRLLYGLANFTDWWCWKLNIPCRQVGMDDWRKHFFGYCKGGRAVLKQAAKDACALRGWNVANDDEADAAGVLDYGLHCIGVHTPWRDATLMARALQP